MKFEEKLKKMIQCQTVSKEGSFDEKEFLKLRDLLPELFPTFFRSAELSIFGDDCWIFRIKGKDSSRRIMLMSHHDVAPVFGEWKHPAFSGEIIDGKIWGRGTVDTKGPLFAELEALDELLCEGVTFPCDVYLGSSCNEEIGGDGIPKAVEFFTKNNMNFDLVLDEGGAVLDPPLPGISKKCALVAVHEKGRYQAECTFSEAGKHQGLSGKKESPAVKISRFVTDITDNPPFITRLYPEVRAMFEGLSDSMSQPFKFIFKNLSVTKGILLKLMPNMSPQAAALIGTACSFSEFSSGVDENGKSFAKVTASLKCVDDEDFKKDLISFKKVAGKYGIEVKDKDGIPPEFHKPSKMSGEMFDFVMDTVKKAFPFAAVAPMLLPAGTDSRHFADICPCVMRFAPIVISAEQFASVHSPNENLDVSTLKPAVEFYKSLLRALK